MTFLTRASKKNDLYNKRITIIGSKRLNFYQVLMLTKYSSIKLNYKYWFYENSMYGIFYCIIEILDDSSLYLVKILRKSKNYFFKLLQKDEFSDRQTQLPENKVVNSHEKIKTRFCKTNTIK